MRRIQNEVQPFLIGVLVFVGVILVVGILLNGRFNRKKAREFFSNRGARMIYFSWFPFAPDWTTSGCFSAYKVRYEDTLGVHEAYCRLGLLSGIYLVNDEIIEFPPKPNTAPAGTERNQEYSFSHDISETESKSRKISEQESQYTRQELLAENKRLRAEVTELKKELCGLKDWLEE